MANKEPVKWITVNGRHIPIYEDGVSIMPRPIIGGSYKSTPEMQNLAMKVAIKLQKQFPELLADEFEMHFNKYMSAMGYGFRDRIELDGAGFKKLLKSGEDKECEGLVAHEIIHTIQARLNTAMELKGDEREKNIDRIMDNVIKRYASDKGVDVASVSKTLAHEYGGGGHSRLGGASDEKMSVAVQSLFIGESGMAAEVGQYVLDELRVEIDKKGIKYRKGN